MPDHESEIPLLTLDEAKQQLRVKTQELLEAPAARIPALAIELQRLRVACLMLREIENDIADPNTYREVALLNRLLSGHDVENEAEKRDSINEAERAQRVLEAKGISPESATRMIKALSSVMGHEPTRTAAVPAVPAVLDDDPLADEPDETADGEEPAARSRVG